MRPWNVDLEKLREVGRALGIKLPVRVKLTRRLKPHVGGRQSTEGGKHEILLNTALSRERANKSLLHELTHCVQRERLGDNAVPVYTLAHNLFGYPGNPLEVEAERVADALSPIVEVVR